MQNIAMFLHNANPRNKEEFKSLEDFITLFMIKQNLRDDEGKLLVAINQKDNLTYKIFKDKYEGNKFSLNDNTILNEGVFIQNKYFDNIP